MADFIILGIVFLIGLSAGLVDALASMGGLISIPLLIFLGLPPQNAIATDRIGIFGSCLGSIYKFWKEKLIVWRLIIPLTILTIAAGFIGANIVITLDAPLMKQVLALAMLVSLLVLFSKRDLGIINVPITRHREMAGYALFFLAIVFVSAFPSGTGFIYTYILITFFGITALQAQGADIIPWIAISIISLIVFGMNGLIDIFMGIAMFSGTAIGGYAGAHIAVKKGNKWMKALLGAIVVLSAIKLLFFG